VCQPGDSGGPVIQRTSNGNEVNVAGIIVAERIINGIPDPSSCAYQQQGYILNEVNGYLETF
jgi:hypothetical protein